MGGLFLLAALHSDNVFYVLTKTFSDLSLVFLVIPDQALSSRLSGMDFFCSLNRLLKSSIYIYCTGNLGTYLDLKI